MHDNNERLLVFPRMLYAELWLKSRTINKGIALTLYHCSSEAAAKIVLRIFLSIYHTESPSRKEMPLWNRVITIASDTMVQNHADWKKQNTVCVYGSLRRKCELRGSMRLHRQLYLYPAAYELFDIRISTNMNKVISVKQSLVCHIALFVFSLWSCVVLNCLLAL